MTGVLGVIGGSGLTRIEALKISRRELVKTPYGEPSAPLLFGDLHGLEVVFMPRHGSGHTIPPHQVNYRANVWAMREAGIQTVVGMTAVGGLSDGMGPGTLCVPDQLIDYTYGRQQTFFDDELSPVTHVDFTEPYCQSLRERLIDAARSHDVRLQTSGTYGVTQGPRLETAMEVRRLARDGCDLVGMTGMPEAALARELDLCYANFSLVVNWAAGLGTGPITMQEIEKHLNNGMSRAVQVISSLKLSST